MEVLRPEVFSSPPGPLVVGGTDAVADDTDSTYIQFSTTYSLLTYLPTPEMRENFQFVLDVRAKVLTGFLTASIISGGSVYASSFLLASDEFVTSRAYSRVTSLTDVEAENLFVMLAFSAFGGSGNAQVSEITVTLKPMLRGGGGNFASRGRFGGGP